MYSAKVTHYYKSGPEFVTHLVQADTFIQAMDKVLTVIEGDVDNAADGLVISLKKREVI